MASISIHDIREYQKYLDRSEEVFARHRGRYLAVDQRPEILEGEWNYDRAVLIHFECQEDFEAWYRSEEYKEILKFRCSSADCDTILIHGS